MYNWNQRVSRIGVPGNRATAGIGYIMIPTDADPESYKKMCIQKQMVSLISEFERIDNVRIPKHILVDLEFPDINTDSNIKKTGSAIIWVNIPKFNQAVAVGVLTKESTITSILPDCFSIKKNTKNSNIEISGNADEGLLTLTSDAKSSLKNKIQINILNSEKQGQFGINCNGEILTEAIRTKIKSLDELNIIVKNDIEDNETETLINYSRGTGFSYKDEFGNEITAIKDGVNIISKNIVFGEGTQQMVLGNKLAQLLNNIITQISNITVTTAIGIQPILNKVAVEQLKNYVNDILSENSTLE